MPTRYRKTATITAERFWVDLPPPKGVEPYPATGRDHCASCHNPPELHGWVKTLEGGHIACDGDWIATGIAGEHWPIKPDIFERTYEVDDGEPDRSARAHLALGLVAGLLILGGIFLW